MRNTIRPTYPIEFSIGVLLLIFVISGFLSHQIFDTPFHELNQTTSVYFGMFLVALAVIIMVLIIWEEILFPIRVKEVNGEMVFRNHRKKLLVQLIIYCTIPAIFTFIYLNYEINLVRFIVWASVCTISPVIEKIVSGINNYNDFLLLSETIIQYKNNEKEGSFELKNIEKIEIITDDRNIIEKILLVLKNNNQVIIDLDEMELDAFFGYIHKFITTHYQHLL